MADGYVHCADVPLDYHLDSWDVLLQASAVILICMHIRINLNSMMSVIYQTCYLLLWVFIVTLIFSLYVLHKKGKGSPYSISERRVLKLIPVLASQPAGDVSHKPISRLPLLSARLAVTLATLKRAATSFAAW